MLFALEVRAVLEPIVVVTVVVVFIGFVVMALRTPDK
jgi:hypothetical protein